jgi:hypothetical protein
MKSQYLTTLIAATLTIQAGAQTSATTYTNFIRQVQLPSAVEIGETDQTTVAKTGQQESTLAINPYGARFELHTVSSNPFASYLLDTRYVGAYVPMANITIRTEDINSIIPRTRADRPFYVDIEVSGLRDGLTDPDSAKKVKFLHHLQSYGSGDGTNIDRTQATLDSQSYISKNGIETLTYTLSTLPGGDRSKIRGEERFSVFSLADYQAPESQLATQFIQIWPVASGTLSGIATNETIEFSAPSLTIAVNDIYPEARIYAQVYQGNKRDDGFVGTVVPGSAVAINEAVPQNRLLNVSKWDSVLTEDGVWTMELLTSTVFGIDRLAYVTFNVDRTISVNASVTTIEE